MTRSFRPLYIAVDQDTEGGEDFYGEKQKNHGDEKPWGRTCWFCFLPEQMLKNHGDGPVGSAFCRNRCLKVKNCCYKMETIREDGLYEMDFF